MEPVVTCILYTSNKETNNLLAQPLKLNSFKNGHGSLQAILPSADIYKVIVPFQREVALQWTPAAAMVGCLASWAESPPLHYTLRLPLFT
jgi:hypothetical protein